MSTMIEVDEGMLQRFAILRQYFSEAREEFGVTTNPHVPSADQATFNDVLDSICGNTEKMLKRLNAQHTLIKAIKDTALLNPRVIAHAAASEQRVNHPEIVAKITDLLYNFDKAFFVGSSKVG